MLLAEPFVNECNRALLLTCFPQPCHRVRLQAFLAFRLYRQSLFLDSFLYQVQPGHFLTWRCEAFCLSVLILPSARPQ